MAIKVPMDPAAWRWRRRVLVPLLRHSFAGGSRANRAWTADDLRRLIEEWRRLPA